MRPPFVYFGGKSTIAKAIVERMPAHRGYVEPYAGGLSVLLAKPPEPFEVINDLESHIVTFWRVLRDQPDDLLYLAECTPASREEYASASRLDGDDDLAIAWAVWVTLSQGRARQLVPTGWRGTYDVSSRSLGQDIDTMRKRILPCAERLRSVQIEHRDALDVIEDYGANPECLLYVDPPYLGSTRSAGKYKVDNPTEDHHRKLASILHRVNGPVILSGYPSPLYDELFPDWYQVRIGVGLGNGNAGVERTETIWSNVDIDQATLFPINFDALEDA